MLAKCCIRKVSLTGKKGYLFYPRYHISNNCVLKSSEKIHFRCRNEIEIKYFFVLRSLLLSVHIFVSFFSHYCVHIVIKQSIEEVFRFCFEWIQKTLPETSVRCNYRSCILFEPFPTNFIIFFQFSIISIIYHGSGRWPFKRDAIVIIGIIIIWVRKIIGNVQFRCVLSWRS